MCLVTTGCLPQRLVPMLGWMGINWPLTIYVPFSSSNLEHSNGIMLTQYCQARQADTPCRLAEESMPSQTCKHHMSNVKCCSRYM